MYRLLMKEDAPLIVNLIYVKCSMGCDEMYG
jgi:hypothetical protein